MRQLSHFAQAGALLDLTSPHLIHRSIHSAIANPFTRLAAASVDGLVIDASERE